MNVDDVRAFIARTILGQAGVPPQEFGDVVLRPHQLAAAQRLLLLLKANDGALLAEPVGTGKTYTALAVAHAIAADPLIVAPASLRQMWRDALAKARIRAAIVSHEGLSRGDSTTARATFVIIDEAHRVRNPSTRRYSAVAELCRNARVLLLSATPVQNSRDDLAALLALFLGRRAWSLEDDALAAFVVRDARHDHVRLPDQVGPLAVALDVDDDCVDDLAGLPPPVPARDESVAAALLTFGLVHQWTSSRAALVASLRRRRTRALAMLDILARGRVPSRAERAAWTHLGDAMQLAFPEVIVTTPSAEAHCEPAALRGAVEAHLHGIERFVGRLSQSPNPDAARAGALRDIRRRHRGERIIAFCHYVETVGALRELLRNEAGVAALTASGGHVAGGRISRADILRQFTPHADNRVPASERIDLLLTTDVLSEGLNLQAASVVVHLDLPWNPARLEQRVGRVRRLGSPHDVVTVYSLAPPATAERLLRIDARLREKLRVAHQTIGIAGRILPSPLACAAEPSHAAIESNIRHRLESWSAPAAQIQCVEPPFIAACAANTPGFLALIDDKSLAASFGEAVATSAARIHKALECAGGENIPVDDGSLTRALNELDSWLEHRRGSAAVDFGAAVAARSRRAALARVSQAIARAPRHRRALLAPLADAARTVATAALAEGAERVLEMLVRADLPDEAWLRSIAAFGELHRRRSGGGETSVSRHVLALILFQPPTL